MPRLFLALVPSRAALAALDALPRPAQPGVRWLDPATWHVTLRFLGDCDVGEVAAALDGVGLPHVTPRLGPTVTLLGSRVVAVPVSGVEPLRAAVLRATRDVCRPPDDRPYRAHLTLARLRDGARPAVVGQRVHATFVGDAVHLVASTSAPDGASHEVVASWSTTPR